MKNPFSRLFARKPQVVEPTPDPIVLMLPPRSRVVLEGTVIDSSNLRDHLEDAHRCEMAKDATHSSESWFQRLNRKGRRAGKRLGYEIQDWRQNRSLGKTALNFALFCLELLLWLCYLVLFLYWSLVIYCLNPFVGCVFFALVIGGFMGATAAWFLLKVCPGLASLSHRLFADA